MAELFESWYTHAACEKSWIRTSIHWTKANTFLVASLSQKLGLRKEL